MNDKEKAHLVDKAVVGALKGNSKLTMNGGKGQAGVGIIDGTVLTLQENAAVQIAKDMCDDAERHHKKPLKDIPMVQVMEFLKGRCNGRPCTEADVMAEVGRLQNHAMYGDKVKRR